MSSSDSGLPTLTPTTATSASGSASASSAAGSSNNNALSSALASITASSASSASSASNTNSASTASGSNTLTNAPQLSTGSSSSRSISSLTGAPSLTSGINIPTLTNAPTLSGFYSYPPPTVPPLANAPYLQKTSLPENFVFIIVGACIAFVALVIISWRVLTSWSINRRFHRHDGTSATTSYTPLADFKQKPTVQPSHDMKDMSAGPPLPKNFSSGAPTSLFFSPTAEVARQSMRPASSRQETGAWNHMPGGHYRDGSSGR